MKHAIASLLIVAVPLLLVTSAGGPGWTSTSDPVDAPPMPECRMPPISAGPYPCASVILVEQRTGAELYAQSADSSRAPASLTKMMLEVIALEEIAAGRASFADSVLVSEWAAASGGATVEIRAGECVDLGALLRAVVVVSANDAAVAIAEHLAGTEAAFVARMNERARDLECAETLFMNCHGLDLPGEESRSTARDLTKVARRLLELPGAIELASLREAAFRSGAPALVNTNGMLGAMEGVDGLKTGLTSRAGSCFCGTIERNGVRFVSVVLGAEAGASRFDITRSLFERAYEGDPRWIVEPADPGTPRLLLARSSETR
jgi:D-alanyl-D-alanine carboxypeptidase (penicillin-binding protein 5/6)